MSSIRPVGRDGEHSLGHTISCPKKPDDGQFMLQEIN